MTYSNTKPDPGPSPKIDVVQIMTDFSQFASIFARVIGGLTYNHTALNNRNQGAHESIILENQANDPGVIGDLTVLYNKNGPSQAGAQPQLFVQIPQFLPKPPDTTSNLNLGMQLTYNTVNTTGPNQYQSFLPRGNLGGTDTGGMYLFNFGSTNDITVPITISPAPRTILIAIATPYNLTTTGSKQPYNVSTEILNSSQFMIHSTLNAGGAVVPYTFGWVTISLA